MLWQIISLISIIAVLIFMYFVVVMGLSTVYYEGLLQEKISLIMSAEFNSFSKSVLNS